jgi:predicted dehydrogenase
MLATALVSLMGYDKASQIAHHAVGSIDELVRHPDVDIVLVLTTGPQHEEAVRAAIAAREDGVLRVALDARLEDLG